MRDFLLSVKEKLTKRTIIPVTFIYAGAHVFIDLVCRLLVCVQ